MPSDLPLLFGASLDPTAADPAAPLAQARLADELGYDLVLVQDHPYNPGHLDTWTLLTTIAMRTHRVRVGADVSPLPLRPPAMLAKAAATLDVLSGGRALLGLGAGGFLPRVEAFGGPTLTPGESVDALDEGIRLIRQMWTSDRPVTFEGVHHRVRGVRFGPKPTGDIPIWVGALKPRMLRLTGRLADGLLVSHGYAPPATLPALHAHIDAGAEAAGRPPEAIRRAYNVGGVIADTGSAGAGGGMSGIVGDVNAWVETLAWWATDHRMDTFVFWPSGDDPDGQLRRFAKEVVPGARAAVDDGSGG